MQGLQAFVAVAHAAAFAAGQNQGTDTARGGILRGFSAAFALPPALRGLLVAVLGLDPVFKTVGEAFLLPERRLGLEVVHDEDIGFVGVFAVCAIRIYKDDIFADIDTPHAMHHPYCLHGPALPRQTDNAFDLGFGHTGEVFQHQMRKRRAARVVTHGADKAHARAAVVAFGTGNRHKVDGFGLDTNTGHDSAPGNRRKNGDFVARLERCNVVQQLLIQRQLEDPPGTQGFFPVGAAQAQLAEQVVGGAAGPGQLLAARGLQQFEGTEIGDGDHDFKQAIPYRSSVV